MRSGRRRPCLQSLRVLLCLFWFASFASVHVGADSLSQTGTSASDWGRFFRNDVCKLKRWMNTDCQPDKGAGDVVVRHNFNGRNASTFTATSCTCTIPYYNIWCGCNLLKNEDIDSIFETWSTDCKQSNISVERNTSWLLHQGKEIPGWAYTSANNGTFNFVAIQDSLLPSTKWTVIQILVPVIVGVSIVLLGVTFLSWRHYRLQKSRGQVNSSLSAFFRNLFKRRAPSVVHQNRNETWVIDGQREQVVNDSGNDTDSFFMVQRTPLIDSPVHEVSRWSTTNISAISPLDARSNAGVYSFTPPRNRSSIEHHMFGTSTIRSLGERVKDLLPWVSTRPVPVNNIRPARGYRIDPGNRSTRTNTVSTLSTRRGKGGYETISEVEGEEVDQIGTGRTRRASNGRGTVGVITEEEKTAVASSVILIGDQDFTLESGSTDYSQQRRSAQRIGTPGRGAATEDVKSPSLNFSFEPPSPTVESVRVKSPPIIPASPGAPPLLPPAPQGLPPPPPPPTNTQATPRRTPSPHLRISTQLDENPLNPSSSNPNKTSNHEIIPNQPQSTSRISPSNTQVGYYQDPGDSNTGTNALSYVTLPGISHGHSRASFDSQNDFLAPGAPGTERRSGSRPLPPPPAEPPGPVPLASVLTHHESDTSMVPSGAMTNIRNLSSVGDAQSVPQSVLQQSEFDPYTASGIPRPIPLEPNRRPDAQHQHPYIHNHQRTASGTSLPRAPGDSVGHLQRGWSADDDASLLDHPPMEVDDGMSGSRGVYIAAPRDVTTLGALSSHYRAVSTDSFATVMSDSGTGENARDSHRFSSGGEFSPQSPTLSMLQADPRNRASYAGRRSISGASGWDVTTQPTHGSPIEPPLPPRRSPNLSPHPPATLDPPATFSPQPSPRPSHVRLGSDTSLAQANRSRDDFLNPARNDPIRLFPASVRAAGYTTGLGPDSVPVPVPSRSHTPRPSVDANMYSSVSSGPVNGSSSNNINDVRGASSNGAFSGRVERVGTQVTGGGTWGTESSGTQSVFESVQQLPDAYPHGTSSRGFGRTP